MSDQNKYKTARNMAGMTLEQAAEKSYIGIGTIKRIERGTQPCGTDHAKALADAYNAPWVADPTVPDDYSPMPKACAMLRYINEREDVDRVMPGLRRILADNKVDEHEAAEFSAAMKEIEEEKRAGRDLAYAL
jgi:transcriptional regulator with XRE-family HTH domain